MVPTRPHTRSWRSSYSWSWDDRNFRRMSYNKRAQDHLTGDVDSRVKLVVKLMEEDGESFKLHAEMYYNKRPELLKLVEEFYESYRSLSERYDQATMALQQLHQETTKTPPNPAHQSQNFLSSSRYMDSRSTKPQALIQSYKLYRLGDAGDDAYTGLRCHFHISINEVFDPLGWRGGLKQVSYMFASSGASKKIEDRCNDIREQLKSLREKQSGLEEKLKVASFKWQKCTEMTIEREIKINLLEKHLQHLEVGNRKLEEEVKKKTGEVHELHVTVEEQRIQFLQVGEKLSTLEKLIPRYENELGFLTLSKQDLEQKVGTMEEQMQNLQYEKVRLEGNQLKLQCKMLECTLSREALQEENSMRKEQAIELELRQMEMDGLQRENGSLQEKMTALQEENTFLLNEFSCREKEFEVLIQKNHIALVSSMIYEEKARELIKLDMNGPGSRDMPEIGCVDESGADVEWEMSQTNVTETFPSDLTMDPSWSNQVANLGNQVPRFSNGDMGCKRKICVACTKESEITLKDIQPDHLANITRHKGLSGSDEWNADNHEQVWEVEKTRKNLGVQNADLSAIEDNGSVKEGGMDLVLYKEHVSKQADECSQHDWSKVAQRLSKDGQRLTALQAGAWELRRKLEIVVGRNQTNNLEFDFVQEQVKHTKDSISQLIKTNAKLMSVAKCSSPSDGHNDGFKKVYSEQTAMEYARRESRQIGMLELELQQAQYIVLKVEEDVESQKSKAKRRGPRVVLGDYLFGKSERRRFPGFCRRVETKDNCHIKRSFEK